MLRISGLTFMLSEKSLSHFDVVKKCPYVTIRA